MANLFSVHTLIDIIGMLCAFFSLVKLIIASHMVFVLQVESSISFGKKSTSFIFNRDKCAKRSTRAGAMGKGNIISNYLPNVSCPVWAV